MIMLKTNKLTVGYEKKIVVDNVEIEVNSGEILCFLGANGAGKTTILRTLSGLLTSISGEVYIKEKNLLQIDKKELAKKLALVLTNKFEGSLTTVYEVVAMGRYPHTGFFGKLSEKDNEIVFDALKTVNADKLKERYFDELSDGEKQKVLVARALAGEPEIIILDEPTTHLDIKHRLELMDILKKLSKDKNIAVVVCLHEIDIALKSADKVVLVKDNEIFAYGAPEDVVDEKIINNLYGMESNYNNLLGSVEIENTLKPEVFVLGGCGKGTPIYRIFTKSDIGISTGIIYENDIDYEIARTMGIKIYSLKPYKKVEDGDVVHIKNELNDINFIIDAGSIIGDINFKNTEIIKEAIKRKKTVVSLRSKEESMKLYGDNYKNIVYFNNVSDVLKEFYKVVNV